jgi:hypothetical protein
MPVMGTGGGVLHGIGTPSLQHWKPGTGVGPSLQGCAITIFTEKSSIPSTVISILILSIYLVFLFTIASICIPPNIRLFKKLKRAFKKALFNLKLN